MLRPFELVRVLLLALALCACGMEERQPGPPDGAALYIEQGCKTCHGAEGGGTALAPSLAGVRTRWTQEQLLRYLTDPQAYAASDPRLKEQARKYMLPMPKFGMLRPEQLRALADHALAVP